jgi:hypothetical protein
MRSHLPFLRVGVLGVALLAGASLFMPAAAAAKTTIAPTTTCSNGVDNSGGLGLICRVTIVNRVTASGGSAVVTVRECHGAAGDPTAGCTTTVRNLTRPVTHVTQCNDSINGGGGTLRCSVRVVNNFVGVSPGSTAATVNQCVGSGGGIMTGCDPFPATTTGATITQCNGSANGGTLVGLTCTATGSKSSARTVRINQCNGSANGGGALVICSASMVNRVVAAGTTGSGTTTSSSGGTTPRAPDTSTIGSPAAQPRELSPLLLPALGLLVAVSLLFVIRRTDGRPTHR